jgi:hypothetical protein
MASQICQSEFLEFLGHYSDYPKLDGKGRKDAIADLRGKRRRSLIY